METHFCSNCGSVCGYDGRCGDGPYLVCSCASQENSYWVSEGSRGGYTAYVNGAHPIRASEMKAAKLLENPEPNAKRDWDNWSREDD